MALTTIDDRGLKTPIDLLDNEKIRFGTGNDLEIYHDGSANRIKNTNAGTDIYVQSANGVNLLIAGTESAIKCLPNAAVELYYDSSKKFETSSAGVTVTGDLTFSDSSSNDIILQGGKIYGETAATGALTIQSTNGNSNHAAVVVGENYGSDNGGITFYGAGSSAADVKMRIRGTTDNIEIPDSHKLNFGDGNDLQIYHSGTESWINNTTGDLIIRNSASTGDVYIQVGGAELGIKAIKDGAVELFYDDSKKFETNASGIHVPGEINVKGNTYPDDDDSYDLGLSNRRWDNVYATSGTVNTSDKTEKNTIVESDLGLNFVNKLKPVSYKWNKNDGKTHYGLIAQDVEETLSTEGKTDKDFAALNIPTEGLMGLNYSEFISPLIKAIQELTTKIETLETEVAALKAK